MRIAKLPRKLRRPSAKFLALVALSLWLASLTQVGLVLYADQSTLSGIEILASGWLGLLALNIAWYANPLFIYAVLRIPTDRPAFISIVLGTFLSLDAWLYSSHTLNEGGSRSLIYGYGWGYVFWLSAFAVLLWASGTRWLELRASGVEVHHTKTVLRSVGIILTVATLFISGANSIRDHLIANAEESKRLYGLAFKRRSVCETETINVVTPLPHPNRPLELKLVNASGYTMWYPFLTPEKLLESGVPAVRFNGQDYRVSDRAPLGVVQSVSASGPPSGLLVVSVKQRELTWQHPVVERPYDVHLRLEEHGTDRVVFEQTWVQEEDTSRYCPDYSPYARRDQQPLELILRSLGDRFKSRVSAHVKVPQAADNLVSGSLFGEGSFMTSGVVDSFSRASTKTAQAVAALVDVSVRNCPEHIRWQRNHDEGLRGYLQPVLPLLVGERAFFPDRPMQFSAYCDGEFVYLNSDHVKDGNHFLTIEKRRLSDFQMLWTGIVKIDDRLLRAGRQPVEILSVGGEGEQPFRILVGQPAWPSGVWIQALLRTEILSGVAS